MAIYRDIWIYMAIYGDIWRYMAIYDDIWRYMEIYGDIWRYMAIYGDTAANRKRKDLSCVCVSTWGCDVYSVDGRRRHLREMYCHGLQVRPIYHTA